jgi:hypothetical protein
MAYDAFISYSHAADDKLAPAIQSALHRLAKPFYRLRALNVFRDKTGLAASPGLWSAIETALQKSKHFILLASPESARSEWVQKEVAWWLDHRSPETLLVVLTGGEIVWDGERGDLDWTGTSALSVSLRGQFRNEPLYVDLRWAHGRSDVTLRNARFLDAILDLASPLHGKAKNDLAGEEVRQSRIVRAITGTAAVIFAGLALVAWYERDEAKDQTVRAEKNAAIAAERQRVAEMRLKNLCDSWKVATRFVEQNIPAAVYDVKARMYEVFHFDDNCQP